MSLPPRTDSSDLKTIVETTLAPQRDLTIRVIDPEDFTITTPYDPLTGLGGEKMFPDFWTGPARGIAMIRSDAASSDELTPKRQWKFAIPVADDTPFFRKGLVVFVTAGPRKSLMKMSYQISSAVEISMGVEIELTCESEGAEISD